MFLRGGWLVLLALGLGLAAPPAAAGADRPAEIQARKAFVAGEYDKAIDLFAGLYAETLHPVYLRNLGRCHQRLGHASKAIEFFRDYLRKGQSITPDERKEIEGYIGEMEQLQKQERDAAAAKHADSDGADKSGRPVVLAPAAPPQHEARSASAVEVAQPGPALSSPPVYTRWWFWTALGGGAAGATTAVILSRSTSVTKPPCPSECYGP